MSSNPSILSIYLSVRASVLLYVVYCKKSILLKAIFLVSIIFLVIAIIYLGSRVALVGLAGSFLYLWNNRVPQEFRLDKTKKFHVWLSASSFLILLLFAKGQSTLGRLFIWQQSFKLFLQNWQTGVGWGRFNVAYNNQQAAYFQDHSRISSEALRANDGYYAFNEWLHIIVETGLPGLLLLSLLAFVFVFRFKAVDKRNSMLSMAILIPIFMASLVSYPFHDTVLLSLSFIGLILFLLHPLHKYFAYITWCVGITYSANNLVRQYKIQEDLNKVGILTQTGYNNEARKTLQAFFPKYKYHPNVGTAYILLLYHSADYKKLFAFYSEHHTYHCNQKLHAIMAKAYNETGDMNEAEKHYLTSIFITPHLLNSRWEIVKFYHQQKEILKAQYWAKELLTCPIKNPYNQQAYSLKQKAKAYLHNGYMYQK